MLVNLCIFASYCHQHSSINWSCGILKAVIILFGYTCFFLPYALFFNLLLSLPNPDMYVCVSLGLPGGIARSTHSSSSSDIKREEKEDDDNLSDKTDDEKKDHKVARNRAR